ncbi:MAG: cysteine desulfurase-like protein [Acidimicrobiia bacterium]|jgi:cysteine desulfurase family protein (TIGR01976 family)
MSKPFDIEATRARFPALARVENGHPVAYLDGPGGTQVPQSVIDAMGDVLRNGVSNLGGGFGASDDAVRVTAEARSAVGRFLSADSSEVSFGQNMTSLTFAISRAIAETWAAGDAIVLTSLDHDANYTPWHMAAERRGVAVRVAEFDTHTGLLDPRSITDLLDERVRLVALCLASNSLGTVVDVVSVAQAAREIGALTYVDAVHAGPHLPIDVGQLGCDFLVASAYKFFGPHTGILYGRNEHMASLEAFKVRPAPSDPPGKWETGTQSFESLAGVTAAVEYLESIGSETITRHELTLGERFLSGLEDMGHVRLFGQPEMGANRVATFAVSVDGMTPAAVARRMVTAGIYVWAGHYYAVNTMERLGVLDDGGLVRIGFCHYNTFDEVDRTLEVLDSLG